MLKDTVISLYALRIVLIMNRDHVAFCLKSIDFRQLNNISIVTNHAMYIRDHISERACCLQKQEHKKSILYGERIYNADRFKFSRERKCLNQSTHKNNCVTYIGLNNDLQIIPHTYTVILYIV